MKKKEEKKQAKFFCESCGAEVKQNAKFCNYCGKFFSSVRCPKCGCTGRTDQFTKGCPSCGYAVTPQYMRLNPLNNTNSGYVNSKSKFNILKNNNPNRNSYHSNDSLPVWTYIVSIIALVSILFGMYSCLK